MFQSTCLCVCTPCTMLKPFCWCWRDESFVWDTGKSYWAIYLADLVFLLGRTGFSLLHLEGHLCLHRNRTFLHFLSFFHFEIIHSHNLTKDTCLQGCGSFRQISHYCYNAIISYSLIAGYKDSKGAIILIRRVIITTITIYWIVTIHKAQSKVYIYYLI